MLKFLSIGLNFCLYLFKNKIVYYFVNFMVSKKWRTTDFFPSCFWFLLAPRYEIRDGRPYRMSTIGLRTGQLSFFSFPLMPFCGSFIWTQLISVAAYHCGSGSRGQFLQKNQCCGSGMFIPDPGSDFFPSWVHDPNFFYPGWDPHKRIPVF